MELATAYDIHTIQAQIPVKFWILKTSFDALNQNMSIIVSGGDVERWGY